MQKLGNHQKGNTKSRTKSKKSEIKRNFRWWFTSAAANIVANPIEVNSKSHDLFAVIIIQVLPLICCVYGVKTSGQKQFRVIWTIWTFSVCTSQFQQNTAQKQNKTLK